MKVLNVNCYENKGGASIAVKQIHEALLENNIESKILVSEKNSNDKNINSVMKTIDDNINSSDDWKMFEKAFNNADKKFFKKVKKQHPDLTSNDLRLCMFLRMNLNSMEHL